LDFTFLFRVFNFPSRLPGQYPGMNFKPGLRSYLLLLLLASLTPVFGALATVYEVAANGLSLASAAAGLGFACVLGACGWFMLAHRLENAIRDLADAAFMLSEFRQPPRLVLPVQELADLGQALNEAGNRFAQERARRNLAEGAQKQSLSMLAEVQRAASIASWEWDIATGGIFWSEAMYKLFRLAPESGVASRARLISLIHSHDRARAAAWLASLTREEIHQPIEFQILRADGEIRTVHCESRQAHDESGNLYKILGTIRDVTDLKRLEARLAESAGQNQAAEETVEIGPVVGAAIYLAEPNATRAGVLLHADVSSDAGEIKGSERALKEILSKLLDHAVSRSPQGAQVVLRAEPGAEGGLVIEIGDAGPPPGMDETGKDGALATVKALIENQGGSFRLAASPENGLTVSLRLPAERVLRKVA
jgi:PAS domain S-box-containing protein